MPRADSGGPWVSGGRLIVFARAPVAGAAKTRLIPALGAAGAAALHGRLVEFTVAKACEAARLLNAQHPADPWHIEVACTPDVAHPFLASLAERFPVSLTTQHGADLGERMHHALGTAPAILFGSDCPALRTADLLAAVQALTMRALTGGNDAVLGPAADGGYYLVGTRSSNRALFEGMTWGHERVLEQTRLRARGLRWRWHELPVYPDVDRPEDLVHLPDALR